VENFTLSNKDWFTGVFLFNLYGALTDYNGVQSDHRQAGLGNEENYFDNSLVILNKVINDSYVHFLETDRIEIFFKDRAYGFQNWVGSRRHFLNDLFGNDEDKLFNIRVSLDIPPDIQDNFQHTTKYGLTPENLQNFVLEKS
jgi:hypothetical protein